MCTNDLEKKTVGGVSQTKEAPFWQPRHFHHFNNQIFSMKNPLKNPNNPLSKENTEMTCKSFYIFYKEIVGINKITNHVKSKRLKNFSTVILLF